MQNVVETKKQFVSESLKGEKCNFNEYHEMPPLPSPYGPSWRKCKRPATHKVEETVFHDDPDQNRHPLTAYLCEKHFRMVVGGVKK